MKEISDTMEETHVGCDFCGDGLHLMNVKVGQQEIDDFFSENCSWMDVSFLKFYDFS